MTDRGFFIAIGWHMTCFHAKGFRKRRVMMKITLKDGSVKEYAESKSVYEIAQAFA